MSRPPPVTSAVFPWRVMWCISLFLGVGGFGDDRFDASADQPETEEGDGHDRRAEREDRRSEEHTSEFQSLMRISYAVFWLKKKIISTQTKQYTHTKK